MRAVLRRGSRHIYGSTSTSALTTTLRDAAGAEIRSTDIAFARRPKSCGPEARRWPQGSGAPACYPACGRPPEFSGQLNPDGDDPKRINRHRGEHEASRKNHRVRNAGRCSTSVVTVLVCSNSLLHTRLRTHDASGVPRALSQEGNGPNEIRRPRAAKNRGDDACPQFFTSPRSYGERSASIARCETGEGQVENAATPLTRSFHSRPLPAGGERLRKERPGMTKIRNQIAQ